MRTLPERHERLLEVIIREYIRTAEPVASGHLHGRFGFTESSATIRSVMAELEQAGFLTHPHTSAGRIPTEKGYRYYIAHCLEAQAGTPNQALRTLESSTEDVEDLCKAVTRALVEITGEVAFVGVGNTVAYYTGISQLLQKPEFHEYAQVLALGAVLDEFHEVIQELTTDLADDIQILLGKDNPFGQACSSIVIKLPVRAKEDVVLGLLGPMRMNYNRNVDAVLQAYDILEHAFEKYE